MWKITKSIPVVVLCVLMIASCEHMPKKGPSAAADNQILSFEDAMGSLVKGLNELSNKEKDYGMLIDQINVKFTLAKTDKNEFGINLSANSEVNSTTKFESFNVEKGNDTNTSQSSSSLDIFNSLVGGTDAEKSENKTTTNETTTDSASETAEKTKTDNATVTAGGTTGANVSANYSSVQTGSGENVITIQFKSLATYPKDKATTLARLGKLGCLAFYIDVLGSDISKPDVVDAAMAAINKITGSDDGCEGVGTTITESGRGEFDTSSPTPIETGKTKVVK